MQKTPLIWAVFFIFFVKMCILHKKLVAILLDMVYNYEQGVIDSNVRKLKEQKGRSVCNYGDISGKQDS